jgi:hypothetical protein
MPQYYLMGSDAGASQPNSPPPNGNVDSPLRSMRLSRHLSVCLSLTLFLSYLLCSQNVKTEHDMGLALKNPILELFFFHRIVVDEAQHLRDEKLCKGNEIIVVIFILCNPPNISHWIL